MTNVRATLLRVFAQHQLAAIDEARLTEAFGEADFAAVRSLPDYKVEYDYAKKAKLLIERYERQYQGQVDQQALMCLNMLTHLRGGNRFNIPEYEVFRDLILKTLLQTWPKADQDRFVARLAIIDEWTDFFISYTNRNAYTTNDFHQPLIAQEFAAPVRPESELAKFNFVARVIAKYLEQNNLKGFVDFKSLKCGDDIEYEVIGHCQRTIAFVQLVEATSFVEPAPPTVNWCLREFEAFSAGAAPATAPSNYGNRLFFLLVGGATLPRPARMALSYADWHAGPARTLHVVLNDYAKPFLDLQSKIGDIATQITEARKSIIESTLASWS